MHFVKDSDIHFPIYANAIAQTIAAQMAHLKRIKGKTIDDERWVQEAVMLTLLDGASTIAASMGVSSEAIARELVARYSARKAEMMHAADGSLKTPERLV